MSLGTRPVGSRADRWHRCCHSKLLLALRHESRREEVKPAMTWETPEFIEIKMDAEMSSYQES
jgi:hypothetical protein